MVGVYIGIGIGLLALLLIVWGIGAYNNFVKMRNNVDEAFSTMDVYLKKRFDLVPNLVETVKGYAKHEKETLTKVIEARNAIATSQTADEKIENEAKLTSVLKTLSVVVEKYPELKADKNFMELQGTLQKLEEEIANSRKYYNGCVKIYNTKREVFPSNIIANMFKFEKRKLFEVDSAEERKNVKVSF